MGDVIRLFKEQEPASYPTPSRGENSKAATHQLINFYAGAYIELCHLVDRLKAQAPMDLAVRSEPIGKIDEASAAFGTYQARFSLTRPALGSRGLFGRRDPWLEFTFHASRYFLDPTPPRNACLLVRVPSPSGKSQDFGGKDLHCLHATTHASTVAWNVTVPLVDDIITAVRNGELVMPARRPRLLSGAYLPR